MLRRADVLVICWSLVLWFGNTIAQGQENWTRFRGPDGTGVVADDPRLPDTWDQEKNVRWKARIPGRGWGSPIVWQDRVFISAVDSDDEYEAPKRGLYLGLGRGEPPDSIHHWRVYCLDFKTGEVLWKKDAHEGKPVVPRHPKNTYAAETPTTDGQRLYVLFGDLGLYCYDFDGNHLWTYDIAPKKSMLAYGAAASPIVVGNQVVFVYDNSEDSYIAAVDGATGKLLWKTSRDEQSTWGTPLAWHHGDTTEIVATGRKENRSYNTAGELLWHFDGHMSSLTIPSPFVVDGLLYITSGYFQDKNRPVYAIKPGANGDITLGEGQTSNDYIKWSLEKMGPYNTSPIVYGGLYYTLLDLGMVTCNDAATGEQVFSRTRFPQGASFTASPWAYNGKIFFLSEAGDTYVMPVGREFTIDHTNSLDELCIATPAIAQGKLLIRTAEHVYCIGREAP
ncbi:MAG TPA: PQQ-binding-like beta-propeller repeat protein [Pirellulales bacterium]|jgi:outer membrane protein assembly factor BamB